VLQAPISMGQSGGWCNSSQPESYPFLQHKRLPTHLWMLPRSTLFTFTGSGAIMDRTKALT